MEPGPPGNPSHGRPAAGQRQLPDAADSLRPQGQPAGDDASSAPPEHLVGLLHQLRDALTHLSLTLHDLKFETDDRATEESLDSLRACMARISRAPGNRNHPHAD